MLYDGFRSMGLELLIVLWGCGTRFMMGVMFLMLVVSLDASSSARAWFYVSPCIVPHRSRIAALRCAAH